MDVGSRGKRQGPPTTVGGKGRWAAPKSLGASWGEQSHCQETLAHWRGQQALGPTWEDTAGIRTDQLLVPSLFPQRAPPSGPSRPCPDCRILISNEWVSLFSPHPCQCLVVVRFPDVGYSNSCVMVPQYFSSAFHWWPMMWNIISYVYFLEWGVC